MTESKSQRLGGKFGVGLMVGARTRPRRRPCLRRTLDPRPSCLTLDSNLLQALGEHACIEEARWAKTLFGDEDDDEYEDE